MPTRDLAATSGITNQVSWSDKVYCLRFSDAVFICVDHHPAGMNGAFSAPPNESWLEDIVFQYLEYHLSK